MCLMQFNDYEWDKHKIWNKKNHLLLVLTHYHLLSADFNNNFASANSLKNVNNNNT